MVKDVANDVAKGIAGAAVDAVKAYGLLLIVIIALILIAAYANVGLDIIKDALNYAISLIP
jgi:hypothetical protein